MQSRVSLLSSRQVVMRVAAIVCVAEFLIMLFIAALPEPPGRLEAALIDVALLAALSTPAITHWVIAPFVAARDEALAEVRALALTDPLTQLANRRLLSSRLDRVVAGSASHGVQGALLLVDLDGFKAVNDEYGHEAGDAVLVAVARRLESVVREEDVAARLGGDEFVLLLARLGMDPATAQARALGVAARLIELVGEPVAYDGVSLCIGASIGIRLLGDGGDAHRDGRASLVSSLLSDADAAMYRAKQAGKRRAIVFGA